jgi:hypothetical protein
MAERGWYPDPELGDPAKRYWDGAKWTEHRSYRTTQAKAPAPIEPDGSRIVLHVVALLFCLLPGVIWLVLDRRLDRGSQVRVLYWYLITLAISAVVLFAISIGVSSSSTG